MEAKDRVMSEEDIKSRRPPDDGYSYYIDFGLAIANVQDKITWDKAIREVVEFIKDNSAIMVRKDDGATFFLYVGNEWQAKLKEWGL